VKSKLKLINDFNTTIKQNVTETKNSNFFDTTNLPKILTLDTFIRELSKKLGVKPSDWLFQPSYPCRTSSTFIPFNQRNRKKQKRKEVKFEKTVPTFILQTEKFKLIMSAVSEFKVEIFMIKSLKEIKGIGTNLMNNILDVSDELGINVDVIPSDYDVEFRKKFEESPDTIKGQGLTKYMKFLVSWYKSFGFKSSMFTPKLTYYPLENVNNCLTSKI